MTARKMNELKNFDDFVGVRIFKSQTKDMQTLMRKYPEIWENESHFIRSAITYFMRHVKEGKFKITME